MDLLTKIIVLLLGGNISLLIYLLRLYVKDLKATARRLEEHMTRCEERNTAVDRKDASNEERMNSLTWEIKNLRRLNHWVGDCLMTLGVKIDARMPQRPATE